MPATPAHGRLIKRAGAPPDLTDSAEPEPGPAPGPFRPQATTSRPRPRSEGMAPDGAALETGALHSPGVSGQVDTQPSLPHALFAFTQVDGTGCQFQRLPLRGSPYGLCGETEVSASLWTGCAAAGDIGLCRRAGCLPQRRRGSGPSVAHGYGIDNFLLIGVPQAPSLLPRGPPPRDRQRSSPCDPPLMLPRSIV